MKLILTKVSCDKYDQRYKSTIHLSGSAWSKGSFKSMTPTCRYLHRSTGTHKHSRKVTHTHRMIILHVEKQAWKSSLKDYRLKFL